MNLDVNFVNNYNYTHGHYDRARDQFERIAEKYPDHAFAHYFLAKTMERQKSKDSNTINFHYDQFQVIMQKDEKWREYAQYFNIKTEPTVKL